MLCRITLDGAALRNNFKKFKQLAGQAHVAPVLKSNAYGHGLYQVYKAIQSEKPEWLCVNYVDEGAAIRGLGYQGRILVVGPAVPRELQRASDLNLDIVIGSYEALEAWQTLSSPGSVHVKFDTGMSRQGFSPADAGEIANALAPKKSLIAGICTHFANVEDVTDHEYAKIQLKLFRDSVKSFNNSGLTPMIHAASSASSLLLSESRFDLLRVGISLYGTWPSSLSRLSFLQLNNAVTEFQPVLSWYAEITTLKKVPAGQFIGYGCTYRAVRDMRIAVVSVGYYEGYPRLAGENASYVLIRGSRCPIVGRICMNMMMVDTTHLPHCSFGDQVTLIGRDGSEKIAADDLAGWSRSIHYEVFARLHPDIPRNLVGS